MPTPDKQLCSLRTAQQVYEREFAHCQRSPEWKAGALAGLQRRESPQVRKFSPYKSGTAQDDAWAAGVQYGLILWKFNQEKAAA